MASSIPAIFWKCVKNLINADQSLLLQRFLCDREPIHKFADIKLGDHLVRKSTAGKIQYEHHFLCIEIEVDEKGERKPKIIHYYNTPSQASWDMSYTSSLASGKSSGKLGIIQEMTLPHKDFIKNEDDLQAKGSEVERVVWPEEIMPYSVPEVIRRARKRMGEYGEKCYHLTKNNCESFVMWCLCDLNISLQVTPRRKALFEAGNAFCKLIKHAILQGLKSAVARGTMRGAASRAQEALPEVGVVIGAALTVLFEIIMVGIKIYNAKNDWKKGVLIKSREEFIKEVIDTVLLALTRSGGSIVGMFVGEPTNNSGGAVLGLFGGHIIEMVILTSTESLAPLIENKIAQIQCRAVSNV